MAETDNRGRFVWYELMTTDPKAAQDFYSAVAGWNTAPFMELPAEARAGGVPPHWMGYVAVPDVDATAAQAQKLGGQVLVGPMDIPNVGRFAVIKDPQGASLSAFRGNQEMASEDPDPAPGDFSWRELGTSDYTAALAFYSDLFGWENSEAMDMGEAGIYQMYGRAGKMLGGMYNRDASQPFPPGWLYYISVADLDAAVAAVGSKGGEVMLEPMEVPGGSRIAVARDPQGATFGLHERAAK